MINDIIFTIATDWVNDTRNFNTENRADIYWNGVSSLSLKNIHTVEGEAFNLLKCRNELDIASIFFFNSLVYYLD